MKRDSHHPLLEALPGDAPPKEDSEDLTDEEIARAVIVASASELAHAISEELRSDPESANTGGFTVQSHELRRRGENLFWRTRLVSSQEPPKVLVYRVNWLGG